MHSDALNKEYNVQWFPEIFEHNDFILGGVVQDYCFLRQCSFYQRNGSIFKKTLFYTPDSVYIANQSLYYSFRQCFSDWCTGNPLLTAFAPSVHFWDTRPETRIQEASASLGLRICSVLATQVTWVRGQQLACIQLGLQTFRNSFQYWLHVRVIWRAFKTSIDQARPQTD